MSKVNIPCHEMSVYYFINFEVLAVTASINVDVDSWGICYSTRRSIIQLDEEPRSAAQEDVSTGKQFQTDLPQIVSAWPPAII